MDPEELYAKGKEAADRGNFEYAIAMFQNVAIQFPGHLNSRMALRACEEQVFQSRGKGAGAKVSAVIKGLGPLLRISMGGKPEKVVAACEKFLVNWPSNPFVLMKLALALRKMGHLDAAIQTLEYLTRRVPQHVPGLKLLADFYEEDSQYTKAAKCYEVIVRLKPADEEAARKHKNLLSMAHMDRTSLDQGASAMDNIRDKELAKKLIQDDQMTKTKDQIEEEISRLQLQLKDSPQDVTKLQQLGDLYVKQSKFKLALQCFEKANQISPRPLLKLRIGDIHLRAFLAAEREAAAAAESNPSEETKKRYEEARQRRIEFEIGEFTWRVEEYPTDMRMAERLGDALMARGTNEDAQKAILQYQKAVADPRVRGRVTRKLASCFARNEATYDMALGQYRRARELTLSLEEQKRIDYEIGLLCEKLKRYNEALEAYKKVYEVDAGFEDVGDRILRLTTLVSKQGGAA
ncbi:MAG TPA: tetratricopeptide repeat protein [Candidatus Brocadiia bacterium]|nr:tetratricopeptide repeat protein [Candidatus Brocadiia bacterium]